jgi:DNA excision repair protein ERCC-5
MEGKRLAIDSSIWLYQVCNPTSYKRDSMLTVHQFQATMRDKDGRVLVNAHVLGEHDGMLADPESVELMPQAS